MSARVLPPRWTLQPFEQALAALEVERLTGTAVERDGDALVLPATRDPATLQRLARRISFARAVVGPDGEVPTLEYATECAAGGGTRKITAHALHGLHPYKGKFYPQLARSLLNICDVPEGGLVVDPFAGCGTAVLEASLLGIRGLGVDANPMAVLVSRAKLRLLGHPAAHLAEEFRPLHDLPEIALPLAYDRYLAGWFPPDNLVALRRLVSAIGSLASPIARDGATVALSSVLREASWQDPKQLRIGRRAADAIIPPLDQLFLVALDALVAEVRAVQAVPGLDWARLPALDSRVLDGDSRQLAALVGRHADRRADAVITSPPYASALPYVDTDRLSLYAFDLLPEGGQRAAEGRLIGNREITDRDRDALEGEIAATLAAPWVPPAMREVLRATAEVARDPRSGFRKRRTPALLFAYFRDMRAVLEQVTRVVRPGGPVAVVIADNTASGPGGGMLTIPTVDIMVALGEGVGLRLTDDHTKRLTSYGAADTVHQRNAMNSERVLLFASTLVTV